jgi:DNA-binding CsgD family transcriptional regulator
MATTESALDAPRRDDVEGDARLRVHIPAIPVVFLGLGVYRAWIEIAFVGTFVPYPDVTLATRDLFDLGCGLTLILCALFARQLGPVFKRTGVFVACGSLLVASTVGLFTQILAPGTAAAWSAPTALAGGVGIGLVILIWSELYGCLNPLRAALYYSASIVTGALILYIYRGFMLPWLFAMTLLLPVATLLMARRAFATIPAPERPASNWVRFSVPWKAIIMMALYAFAYGILESPLYARAFGPHSAPGTLIVAALVFMGVIVQGKRFDFNVTYRLGLPLMIVAFLVIAVFGDAGDMVSAVCVAGGYTAASILIMVICANICYRYGVSAVWLFGIERSMRLLFMYMGRQTALAVPAIVGAELNGVAAVSGIAILAVVMGTLVFLSERELASRWGATFLDGSAASADILRKQEIADRCDELARTHHLTARESEVLLLLAQKKTISTIEHELFIANGTAKAHVRHIYQKLGIHTRNELFEMVGVADDA